MKPVVLLALGITVFGQLYNNAINAEMHPYLKDIRAVTDSPPYASEENDQNQQTVEDDFTPKELSIKSLLKEDSNREKREAPAEYNDYNQGYNDNSYHNGYSEANVNKYIKNKMTGFATAFGNENPTFNERQSSNNGNYNLNIANIPSKVDRKEVYSGGIYPDTVYSSNPKSVITYRDEHGEVITMNDNHITVVQPKRNKDVIHKSFPDHSETIIRDVPANNEIPRLHANSGYITKISFFVSFVPMTCFLYNILM